MAKTKRGSGQKRAVSQEQASGRDPQPAKQVAREHPVKSIAEQKILEIDGSLSDKALGKLVRAAMQGTGRHVVTVKEAERERQPHRDRMRA